MQAKLKAAFTEEQLRLAASLNLGNSSLKDKVRSLFESLEDPLLEKAEIEELLGLPSNTPDLDEGIAILVTENVLERSSTTARPLDGEGVVLYRLKDSPWFKLKLIATEATLNDGTKRYQFTCDGRLIRSFARVDRLDVLAGSGQQRSEINKHVEQIAEGIRAGTQVPNSILVAIASDHFAEDPDDETPDSFVTMVGLSDPVEVPHPIQNGTVAQSFRTVEFTIPFRKAAFDEEKNCFLVDGQQRTAALSLVDVDKIQQFFLSANAVIANPDEAKRIFQVANSTVKISTEFSRALLATMTDAPGYLLKERTRALAVKSLSLDDKESPFFGLVQHPGVQADKRPPIAFNSLFQVVTIFAESALLLEDSDKLSDAIKKGFLIVRSVWADAWGKKPGESRLMHGTGLRSVSSLLVNHLETNFKIHGYDLSDPAVWSELKASLDRLATRIQWTADKALSGTATQKKIYLEEIATRQNTSQDIAALTSTLLKESTLLDKDASKMSKK